MGVTEDEGALFGGVPGIGVIVVEGDHRGTLILGMAISLNDATLKPDFAPASATSARMIFLIFAGVAVCA